MISEYLLQRVEAKLVERSQAGASCKMFYSKINVSITDRIQKNLTRMEKEKTLYEMVIMYIQRLNDPRFFFKNGNVNAAAFYRYACIDKSTWTDLCYGLALMKKKTILKLIIALRLNEDEAKDFMLRASNGFDPKDIRDQIILALIDLKCYEIEDVYEVLEEYRKKGHNFENIYD